jgi:hypothetical protein
VEEFVFVTEKNDFKKKQVQMKKTSLKSAWPLSLKILQNPLHGIYVNLTTQIRIHKDI